MPDRVDDREMLFRRVRYEYLTKVEGQWKCAETAFGDPDKQPSVDRAKLQGGDPTPTRIDATDAVARLIAGDVRGIKNVHKRSGPKGKIEFTYQVDVIPDPTEQAHRGFNPAHARVVTDHLDPDNPLGSKAYRALKDELSAIATVVLEPETK